MKISKIVCNKSISGDLAELLGLLCAEGNYRDFYANYLEFDKRRRKYYFRNNKRERVLEFSNKNIALLKFFRNLLEKEYHYSPKILKSKGDVKRVCITKHSIINDILEHTSIGCDKWKIPESIINGSEKIKKRFIRGFFYGDGSLTKHISTIRIRLTSTNYKGLECISKILNELEIENYFNGPYTRKNRRDCYEILVPRKFNQKFIKLIISDNPAGKPLCRDNQFLNA